MKTQTKLNWLAAAILWSATLDGLSQPRIVTQPIDQWVDLADSVTCFVVVGIVGGTWGTGPTYQWRFNSEDMPGATQRQLVLTNFQANQVGEYSVVASHATGNATSRVARLELNIVRPRVFGNIRALPDGSVSILLDGNPSGRLRKFFELILSRIRTICGNGRRWQRFCAPISPVQSPISTGEAGKRRSVYRTPTNHFSHAISTPTGPFGVSPFQLLTDPSRSNRYRSPPTVRS